MNSFKIELGKITEAAEVFQVYVRAKEVLDQLGVFQWTDDYPTESIILKDLQNKVLYLLKKEGVICGAINLSSEQDEPYKTLQWRYNIGPFLIIHRLVIDPKVQGQGGAQCLMNFAENYGAMHGFNSIRLDVYSKNRRGIKFYQKQNYTQSGRIYFPGRTEHFYCMEKKIVPSSNE